MGVVPHDFNLKSLSGYVDNHGVVNPEAFQSILNYTTDILAIVAKDMGVNDLNRTQIAEVIEMELKLVKLYNDHDYFRSNSGAGFYQVKLDELMSVFTTVGLKSNKPSRSIRISPFQLNSTTFFLKSTQTPPELHSYVGSNPTIYIQNPKLLYDLNQFYSSIKSHLLANYFCTHYILDEHTDLDKRFREALGRLSKKATETSIESERYAEGLKFVQSNFPRITDHLFVTNCVDEETKGMVTEMLDNIQVGICSFIFKNIFSAKGRLIKF